MVFQHSNSNSEENSIHADRARTVHLHAEEQGDYHRHSKAREGEADPAPIGPRGP